MTWHIKNEKHRALTTVTCHIKESREAGGGGVLLSEITSYIKLRRGADFLPLLPCSQRVVKRGEGPKMTSHQAGPLVI